MDLLTEFCGRIGLAFFGLLAIAIAGTIAYFWK